MPELPEVESARAVIEAGALGRVIDAVDDADTWVCRPHPPGEIRDALLGRRLTTAGRQGKSLWCETSGAGGDPGPVLGPPPGHEWPGRRHRPGGPADRGG